MDRFIVNANGMSWRSVSFKIQYGQIYRGMYANNREWMENLKSNMDRFIACLLSLNLNVKNI